MPRLVRLLAIAGLFAALGASVISLGTDQTVSAHHSTSCTDVGIPFDPWITSKLQENKADYIKISGETGVPWEMLAGIHYRETSFSRSNPSNGYGIFQFTPPPKSYPPGPVSATEFRSQLKYMANRLQNDYVWRGPDIVSKRKFVVDESNMNLIKNTLFSYNGRSTQYADQAAHFGYNKTTKPYEGSPYVMNRYDCMRARMGIITRDYGPLDGKDTRYGAYTVFRKLRKTAPYNTWMPTGTSKYVRFIECNNRKFLIERGIRKKREVLNYGKFGLGITNVNYVKNDSGCKYKTYDLRINDQIASRTTGKPYVLDEKKAIHVQDTSIMRAWGLKQKPENLPNLNGSTINALVAVDPNLKRLARSASTGKVYLAERDQRHYLLDSEASTPSPTLQLVVGYDSMEVGKYSSLLIQRLESNKNLDFAFRVKDDLFLLNHENVIEVDPDYIPQGWNKLIDPDNIPVFASSDFVSARGKGATVEKGFRRDDNYYRVNTNGTISSTSSSTQAQNWGINSAPVTTRLLRDKLISL